MNNRVKTRHNTLITNIMKWILMIADVQTLDEFYINAESSSATINCMQLHRIQTGRDSH